MDTVSLNLPLHRTYGSPIWDKTTTYFIGDDVEIDDFDMSGEECSTGFHFFCTIEQAQNY